MRKEEIYQKSMTSIDSRTQESQLAANGSERSTESPQLTRRSNPIGQFELSVNDGGINHLFKVSDTFCLFALTDHEMRD
jgi:hypothetical protein